MGTEFTNKDELKEFIYQFQGSASAGELYLNVPYDCTYNGYMRHAAVASAGLAIGICNVNTTDVIIPSFQIDINPSGVCAIAAGLAHTRSATGTYFISKNSILHVVWSASTMDGTVCLHFDINHTT